jgi:hypothetical protein
MKRKEMATILRDKVRVIQGNKKFAMVDAFQLLNTISKYMDPPVVSYYVNTTMGEVYEDCPKEFKDSPTVHLIENVRHWEPEDE